MIVLFLFISLFLQADPLPSWNEGPAKEAILKFAREFEGEKIAVFDQDGTLWVEQPLYTQAVFALDRLRTMAPEHTEWLEKPFLKTAIEGDKESIAKLSEQDWEKIVAVTHSGMSIDSFLSITKNWLASHKHPRFNRPYTDLTYQPMREVIQLLKENGFKVYIVTGGGQEFVRAFAEQVYGIPPDQVIGSSIKTKFEYQNNQPVLMRLPEPFFEDNYGGKPVGINLFIGKKPAAAFGNSDGDKEMLEWSKGLKMLVLHDDAEREYAYGPAKGLPKTHVGEFSEELYKKALKEGWIVISMKNDWKEIFSK